MLRMEQVWSRAAGRPQLQGKNPSNFVPQVVTLRVAGLAGGATISSQQVNFPSGAIILGIQGSAWIPGGAGTVLQSSGLSLFALTIENQGQRTIVGPSRACAQDVFGVNGDQFPAVELYIPTNASLLYSIENLCTSQINVTISHHCLVAAAVG
jgi:hypothetical protein